MRNISFKDLYNEFVEGKLTPRLQFLERMAAVTGAPPATIAMWLSGYSIPKGERLAKIAAYYDADPAALFPNQKKHQRKNKNQ